MVIQYSTATQKQFMEKPQSIENYKYIVKWMDNCIQKKSEFTKIISAHIFHRSQWKWGQSTPRAT